MGFREPKPRVADALPIERSRISDDLYSYALKAHFDFLVTDGNHQRSLLWNSMAPASFGVPAADDDACYVRPGRKPGGARRAGRVHASRCDAMPPISTPGSGHPPNVQERRSRAPRNGDGAYYRGHRQMRLEELTHPMDRPGLPFRGIVPGIDRYVGVRR
jgi:hypothetical protein